MRALAYIAGLVALTLMSTVICYLDRENERLRAEICRIRCAKGGWQKFAERMWKEREMLREQLEKSKEVRKDK